MRERTWTDEEHSGCVPRPRRGAAVTRCPEIRRRPAGVTGLPGGQRSEVHPDRKPDAEGVGKPKLQSGTAVHAVGTDVLHSVLYPCVTSPTRGPSGARALRTDSEETQLTNPGLDPRPWTLSCARNVPIRRMLSKIKMYINYS